LIGFPVVARKIENEHKKKKKKKKSIITCKVAIINKEEIIKKDPKAKDQVVGN
jgi:hypothetical protein